MTDIKTDPELLEKLKEAVKHPLSKEETHKQRVSFILGSLRHDSSITRDKIEAVLDEREGRAA